MSEQTRRPPTGRARTRPRLNADDRRIAALALPALGALAAEPLYVLVDTAIVGHLGVAPLGALALAGTLLSTVVSLCNFLAYGSTPMVGRLHAAGRSREAAPLGRQTLILALLVGLVLGALAAAAAAPLIGLLGGRGRLAGMAVVYMRIAAIGLPFALIAVAGQGYLRGLGRLRAPLALLLIGNIANAILEVVFVFALHWGIAGSAWATVIAQSGIAVAFILIAARERAVRWRIDLPVLRTLAGTGGEIFIRTAALLAAFLLAGAILARVGAASLAAHDIAFQLWMFLALALDALAIAAQVTISQHLGAGQPARARGMALRILAWSVAIGLLLSALMLPLSGLLPHVFTSQPTVLARLAAIWPIFALMQPFNAAVFALDGILLGAGDTRYLMWAMLAAALLGFGPVALASTALHWGITGIWIAIFTFIIARLASCGWRLRGDSWATVLPAGTPRAGPELEVQRTG